MKRLTVAEAKKIAEDLFKDFTPVLHKHFQFVHSHKVGLVARMVGNKLNIFSDVFEIAGWVHDIGYLRDPEYHAEHSITMVEEMGYEVDETLFDCIINHGNNKSPKTIEGRIFQLADKISVFDPDLIEVMLKDTEFPFGTDSVTFLKNMAQKSFKVLDRFSNLGFIGL